MGAKPSLALQLLLPASGFFAPPSNQSWSPRFPVSSTSKEGGFQVEEQLVVSAA
ncbi:hypothetical protein TRIUR3_11630 [Triticum urartu]|uniref:Uncharacterized protein n=1 Tax=Triticum urartu TaxID=4572 RepID=M7Z2C4_TRIUA|nr:hypothetical protein TRIUR3_11630 [Triticum urartu]